MMEEPSVRNRLPGRENSVRTAATKGTRSPHVALLQGGPGRVRGALRVNTDRAPDFRFSFTIQVHSELCPPRWSLLSAVVQGPTD